ncbi:hypothetical protein WH47_06726 [Habropoda laboriosa]|uniref:Uncharacterized protein n=1 Tax=Habropoda laboriosa TaxID=597456 RepID=A0A0L7RIW7_9HYME|nr:hypothetical protein WH47_06726 [Habropoda laboriosa]
MEAYDPRRSGLIIRYLVQELSPGELSFQQRSSSPGNLATPMPPDKLNRTGLIRPESPGELRRNHLSGGPRIISTATCCHRRAPGDEAIRRPTSSTRPGPSTAQLVRSDPPTGACFSG